MSTVFIQKTKHQNGEKSSTKSKNKNNRNNENIPEAESPVQSQPIPISQPPPALQQQQQQQLPKQQIKEIPINKTTDLSDSRVKLNKLAAADSNSSPVPSHKSHTSKTIDTYGISIDRIENINRSKSNIYVDTTSATATQSKSNNAKKPSSSLASSTNTIPIHDSREIIIVNENNNINKNKDQQLPVSTKETTKKHQPYSASLVNSGCGFGFDIRGGEADNQLTYIVNVQPNGDAARKGLIDGMYFLPYFILFFFSYNPKF